MRSRRFACALIPEFSLEVLYKTDPRLHDLPTAIADANGTRGVIVVANRAASNAGVEAGMTTSQAASLCPELEINCALQERERAEEHAIVKMLQAFSPWVDPCGDGKYILDASGVTRLYKGETNYVQRIIDTLRDIGFTASVGLAGRRFVAEVAVRITPPGEFTIVSRGNERGFLANLASDKLELDGDLSVDLDDLGLRTVETITEFSSAQLAQRFGRDGAALAERVSGNGDKAFDPDAPPAGLKRSVYISYPTCDVQAIASLADQIITPLLTEVHAQGKAASHVRVELLLDDRGRHSIDVRVDKPTLSLRKLMRQLNHALEQLRLPAPVTELTVDVVQTGQPFMEQLDVNRSPSGLDKQPATSGNGANQVFSVRLMPGLLPEQSFMLIPQGSGQSEVERPRARHDPAYALGSIRGLRLYQPPRDLHVTLSGAQPQALRIGNRMERIFSVLGPWEISGWWWADEFDRMYYQIETHETGMYLCFFDRLSSRWYLQGVFD
jgi:nucleotidyltransferase/DNA polymerase involved in DNA repair